MFPHSATNGHAGRPSSDPPSSTSLEKNIDEMKQQTSDTSFADASQRERGPTPGGQPPPYTAFSPLRQKTILGAVTAAGFLGPLAGGVYLPALSELQQVFSISPSTINASISIFMGVLAFAPLFWATFADYSGRKQVYTVSTCIYVIANLLLAVLPPHAAALFILRTIQGIGAASGMALAAGVVVDITEPKHRGTTLSISLLGTQLGPVLGPFLGGLLTLAGWRWIFGFLAIIGFLVWLIILFVVPETLRSIVGNGANTPSRTEWRFYWPSSSSKNPPATPSPKRGPPPPNAPPPPPPPPPPSPPTTTARGRIGAIWRLLKEPTILLLCFNAALSFGAFYAMNITFGRALEDLHHFSFVEVGGSYLALGVALIAGSQSGGRFADYYRSKHAGTVPNSTIAGSSGPPSQNRHHPTAMLAFQIPGFVLCMIGLVLYGWFLQEKVHVAGVIIAAILVSFGLTWVNILTTTYLSEREKRRMATVVALVGMFRNSSAAVASGIIQPLIRAMGGAGACYTGLAGVLSLCIVGLAVLVRLERQGQGQGQAKQGAGKAGRE